MTLSRGSASLIGFSAILLWSTLALFTRWSQAFPPFQLLSLTFSIAFTLMLLKWLICRQNPLRFDRLPWRVWLLGIYGLFGYHACYFIALSLAPAAEASLIAYLWPLLILLFSALLPGHSLTLRHLLAGCLGLSGSALLILRGDSDFAQGNLLGYGAALLCALIWSSYSVCSRLFAEVPTDAVAWFCLVTALLGAGVHLSLENSYWPTDSLSWVGVLGLGLGPVGLAFFSWDYGMKHGDIRLLGLLAYSAPLLSTLLLVLAGEAHMSWRLALAALLISCAALLPWLLTRLQQRLQQLKQRRRKLIG